MNSLDGNDAVTANFSRPDRYRHLFACLKNSKKCIARGSGLSYCNAGAGNDATSVSSLLFNRILSFDLEKGIIVVESGVQIGTLINFALKHNWFFPVIPGHPAITMGGCLAFNVHGKAQYKYGNFIQHLRSFKLFHPDYGEISCSRESNKEIFALTIGGFGLTGYVTEIELQLTKIEHNSVIRKRHQANNLVETVSLMQELWQNHDAVYAWSDLNLSGNNFGKSIVYAEKADANSKSEQQPLGDFKLPKLSGTSLNLYNQLTSSIINRAYFIKEGIANETEHISLQQSIFPLYGHELYFLLFGKKGLYEYSMLIDFDKWTDFAADLQKISTNSNIPLTLTTIRLFRGSQTLLNYTGNGVGINIDVPASKESVKLFEKIDELVIQYQGVVNLSKDSRLTALAVSKIFPEYEEFKKRINEFDPDKRFNSSLRTRLDV